MSDKIKGEFKEWNWGDKIFITAPTGTGKSTFVLYKLITRCIESYLKNPTSYERILYLVNRSILKEQLSRELNKNVCYEMWNKYGTSLPGMEAFINISTYQSIEESLKVNVDWVNTTLESYAIVVYDECHYFYNDSDFNTYTELSYDCLRKKFDNKIQVFMSATMKNMVSIITEEGNENIIYSGIKSDGIESVKKIIQPGEIRPYTMEKSYDYLQLHIFDKMSDLKQIIISSVKHNNEKWLIFTDSINAGERYVEELTDNTDSTGNLTLDKKDVGFVKAGYSNSLEESKIVEQIVEENYSEKAVIISTSVMDNGISFHDLGLRNLVILADTEETFIQMLGRKREDGKMIKLYISRRDVPHFQGRKRQLEKVSKFYDKYEKDFAKASVVIEKEKKIQRLRPYYLLTEKMKMNSFYQTDLLEAILKDSEIHMCARKICYPIGGVFTVNRFALKKCKDLIVFYNQMIKNLQKDKEAFVKQQAAWLNIVPDKIDDFIESSDDRIMKEAKDKIETEIKDILDKPLTREMVAVFRDKIRKDCILLCEHGDDKGSEKAKADRDYFNKGSITKTGSVERPFSPDKFEMTMHRAGLEYQLSQKQDIYIVQRK